MGRFTGPLVIREVGYERWEVVEPFEYWTDAGDCISVPAGFPTDMASVPQILRSAVPKIGYYSQAAVVHDKLYLDHREGRNATITRLQADTWLREGARDKAREYGVPDHLRREWAIYHAVRLGAEAHWLTPAEKAAQQSNMFDLSHIIDR